MPNEALELVYCEEDRADYEELQRKIKERWPLAVIEDASDDIHGYRFQVTIAEVSQDELYTFMIQNKFALQGLGCQLTMREQPDHMRELIAKAKAA